MMQLNRTKHTPGDYIGDWRNPATVGGLYQRPFPCVMLWAYEMFPLGELDKGTQGLSPHIISYNCMYLYNDLKIQSLI